MRITTWRIEDYRSRKMDTTSAEFKTGTSLELVPAFTIRSPGFKPTGLQFLKPVCNFFAFRTIGFWPSGQDWVSRT